MGIVTDRTNEYQSLQEELETMRLNLETARGLLRREEEKRAELQEERDYERRVYALDNQIVSGAQKIIFLALRSFLLSKWDISNVLGQKIEVPMWEIAKRTGLSTDTVGSSIKRLHAVGLVERDDWVETIEGGKKHTHVYVTLTLLSFSLEIIPDKAPRREHGGDRQRCKHCNSDKLVKRTVIVCKSCGMHQDEPEETPVNPPDPLECVDMPAPRQVNENEAASTQEENIPPKPIAACALCERDKHKRIVSWVWIAEDKEYCCQSCYSPFAATERERAREKQEKGVEWTPF